MTELIEMPDGTTVDMTGAPPEAHAALRAKIEGQVASAPKPPSRLEAFGKEAASYGADLIRGAGRGLAGLAEGAAAFNDTQSRFPTKDRQYNELTKGVNAALPTPDPETQSLLRRYGRGVLESLGGAAVTGGAGGGVPITAAVGTGIAETAAKDYAPDNPLAQGVAGILGGIAGGSAAALTTRLRPQTASIAKEALEGISEGDLWAASRYMAQAKANGTPIDLAQALVATKGDAGNLTSVRDALARRSQGNKVQETLRGQPENLKLESDLTLRDLPGTDWSTGQNAANLQETASATIKAAKDARSAAVRQDYAAAGNLPASSKAELGAILNRYATQPGATEVLKARAKEFADKLLGKDPKLGKAIADAQTELTQATSITAKQAAREKLAAANAAARGATSAPLHALDVDTWISELRGPWQGQPLKVAYPKEQGQIKGLAGALNERFQALSPEVAKAEGKFRQITEATVNPLLQGPVGVVAGRGYDAATKANLSNLEQFLNRGTPTNAKISEISTIGKKLSRTNPDAFESSFKGWVGKQMEKASSSASPGQPLGTMDPVKLSAELFDKPNVWQGVKDAAATMADIRGVDKTEYIRGLENLKQLTKAMSSRVNASGLTPQDIERLGGASTTADLVRLASFLPMNRAGAAIERATLGKTLAKFDDILTSPEGAKMLVELGKTPVMSKKAQVLLGTYAGMVANPPELKSSNPKE